MNVTKIVKSLSDESKVYDVRVEAEDEITNQMAEILFPCLNEFRAEQLIKAIFDSNADLVNRLPSIRINEMGVEV